MEITDLLHRAKNGERAALDSVIPLVYNELRRLASSHIRREHGSATIQATALVHEAFLRLAGSPLPEFQNRHHFFGIAARVMRQVLVDLARARQAEKRGPGLTVPLASVIEAGAGDDDAVIALNDALDRLAVEHPRKAELVELRYFGGLTAEESAESLQIPVHTVRRELRLAQAWLHREMASA